MSLTSQIRDSSSPIRQFFRKYENKEGVRECLKLLQSSTPAHDPVLVNASAVAYAFVGTTSDYLIRYAASGNRLELEGTIARQALEVDVWNKTYLRDLYSIGKKYLDGRSATSAEAIYSATALTILDNVFRSGGRLPELFSLFNHRYRHQQLTEHGLTNLQIRADNAIRQSLLLEAKLQSIPHQLDQPKATFRVALNRKQMEVLGLKIASDQGLRFLIYAELVKKMIGEKIQDCPTESLFQAYYTTLGGDSYTQDVSSVVATFLRAVEDPESDLSNARLVISNRALANAYLVGGADFDCIIECKGRMVLTDIKTTKRPLVIEHIRQLLGYALLHDQNKDGFMFSDIGIYHSRSGSFRTLPIDYVNGRCFPIFSSIDQTRSMFKKEIAASEHNISLARH